MTVYLSYFDYLGGIGNGVIRWNALEVLKLE